MKMIGPVSWCLVDATSCQLSWRAQTECFWSWHWWLSWTSRRQGAYLVGRLIDFENGLRFDFSYIVG